MVDFSTFLTPCEDTTDKDNEVEDEGFATNKIKSLQQKSKSRKPSQSEYSEEDLQKNMKTERCSLNEETRNSGSVSGKVFTGYLSAGSNCFILLLVFATNLLCQVT